MWKRGGRSSALDRAQALLSAKRSSRGDAESGLEGPAAKTQGAVSGSVPPNTHTVLSDLSDLSSVSSAPERGADTMRSAAARSTQGREEAAAKDVRPQSSLGGGGSRFLKKAPPPATKSSQSPVSKIQMQQVPEPRNVSSSVRGSQTAALSRLAQIESRIRSRKLTGQALKLAENPTSDLRISPPAAAAAAAQSLEAPEQLSAQSASEQSLRGKRFLKSKTVGAVIGSNTAAAAGSLQVPDAGPRSRSRAADAVVSSASVRALGSVSLESDEEDMRKLLGDSLDSADNSFLAPGRPSSRRTAGSRHVRSTPPPAAVLRSSPASPSRRSSPFRYTGQAQTHFSPSVLSPSPSPPHVSPSPPGRLSSPQRTGSPQRSLSSMSGRSEVVSLEELFPVEDPHSDTSAVSSEDFKINVLTLDDLLPANVGFTEETPGEESRQREAKLGTPAPGSPNRHQLSGLKEKGDKQQQGDEDEAEEDVLDYQSDFEGESRTEQDDSASQVSEHLQGHDDEEEVESEVRGAASESDVSSRGEADDDYSSTFSDVSRSYSSRTSDHSQAVSRSRSRSSRSSRSSTSHSIRRFSHQPTTTRTSAGKVLKEMAVQTQLDPLAQTGTLGPAAMAYIHPSPVITHTLSADTVEALSSFNPAVFALNEVLKQQLAVTRRYIESSRHLHSSLVRSLEPPDYRYTTLEDTKEYIRKRRPPKLTMEEALEEVLQEMRDYH